MATALVLAGLRPAVVVVDLVMPVIDGRELIASLPRLGLASTPVLATTGAAHPELPPGVQLLSKPFDCDELVRRVRELAARPSRTAG